MGEDSAKTTVPVDLLRWGLYVTELDRPWIETPFLFQGFRIVSDEELRTLREYCRVVVIEAERSDAAAMDALRADLAQRGEETVAVPASPAAGSAAVEGPGERERRKSAGVLSEDRLYPDRKRFGTLVRAAFVRRRKMRRAVDDALEQVRMGRLVDLPKTRAAVESVIDVVVEDASAALWLTNLRNRHEYTAIHSVNVCVLTLALGVHLGLERGLLERLGLGALLHDVGKVRTPPDLLDKPGPLTAAEFEIVKRHAQDGHDIVAQSGTVPSEALDIIRLHHERLGGQGYPRGLTGEDIPQHVRIVGLADTYDAMTSDRAYRDARAPDKALHDLYRDAPNSFGVDLVQEFIRCLGIFPVGSAVELDNDAVGVVVGARPGGGLWPVVLMVRAPDGEPFRKRILLNLAAAAQQHGEISRRRIRRAVNPASVGIDVASIAAAEFGLSTG